MTEREFLQQLFLLKCDIEACPMLDPFAAQQRERWAGRLGDSLNRRSAAATAPDAVDPTAHVFEPGAYVCDCGELRKAKASLTAPPGWPGPRPTTVRCAPVDPPMGADWQPAKNHARIPHDRDVEIP